MVVANAAADYADFAVVVLNLVETGVFRKFLGFN
jgi:hypothetical protein